MGELFIGQGKGAFFFSLQPSTFRLSRGPGWPAAGKNLEFKRFCCY